MLLCIWAPILFVVLSGFGHGTGIASGIGLLAVLLIVAPAVGIFIYSGLKQQKYEVLKEENLSLDYTAKDYVEDEKNEFQLQFAITITIGVILCIVSVIPIVVLPMMLRALPVAAGMGAGSFLFLVGIGVFLFIYAGVRHNAYQVLLQEGEYRAKHKVNKLADTIGAIYWPIITCVYLWWSFTTFRWGFTWIIWPIAGILFSVISKICDIGSGKTND